VMAPPSALRTSNSAMGGLSINTNDAGVADIRPEGEFF
jgi:hypothetical protein